MAVLSTGVSGGGRRRAGLRDRDLRKELTTFAICVERSSKRRVSSETCTVSNWSGVLVAAMVVVGDVSTMRSASCAIASKFKAAAEGVITIRTLVGRHCKNSSRMKDSSIVVALSPSNCWIRRSTWVGLRSPNSSAVSSCCRRRCSDSDVRLVSFLLRVSYGWSQGGLKSRSLTSMANSGDRDETT